MDNFKVGDEVKVKHVDIQEAPERTIGMQGRISGISNQGSYEVYFDDPEEDYWYYDADELKLAKKPEEPITETEALKAVLDGKKMQKDMWTSDYLDYIDNRFVIMNANTGKLVYTWEHWCSITSNISEYIWVERIEPLKPPKFQPKQFVANATGDIGIIVGHTGYHGSIPEYSVRFNGVTNKTKPTLESELSEVVL